MVLRGAGFFDHNVHCRFGTELIRAELINRTALVCITPPRSEALSEAVEVTLNADSTAHSLTDDGVAFHFYDPGAVRINATHPLASRKLAGRFGI